METGVILKGEQHAQLIQDHIRFNGERYEELFFEPLSRSATFDLKDVTIGKNFHWQRKENQKFTGALNLIATEEGIVAINEVDVEEYLTSVISSEMSATASKEFLKAHAVISRSWLFAQMERNLHLTNENQPQASCLHSKDQFIRWYDREDHSLFDVCADDHCQRYQGITRSSTEKVKEVIRETHGELLTDGKTICDTRFSKCCGGVTETFEHCWEDKPHSYLTALRDNTEKNLPDLTLEEEAEKWIRSQPEAFCNTTDKNILGQVLNNYDQETTDFFRWKVEYTQMELSTLIWEKCEIGFGVIKDIIPVKRGTSGRIELLKIVGSNKTMTIGKELEIRRCLSESHLYSSAFVVDKVKGKSGVPEKFIFTGAGWGHGVGLCQIGAAVMATRGYNYKEILNHYYPGTIIEKRY